MAKKGKHNPINYGSKKEVEYGHAITHSKSYQKGVGVTTAHKEHDKAVRIAKRKYGMEHHSPFKSKVRRSSSERERGVRERAR